MARGKKVSPAKFLGAVTGIVGGVSNIIGGRKDKRAAERQQQEAQAALDKRIDQFENLDTSNIYANVTNPYGGLQTNFENVYEDLTVNQQQAQFEAQQGAQQRSDILEGMKGAAGGSGVAALAQAMANQGQMATQRASASIGQQEAANRALAAQGAASVQSMEAEREQMIAGGAAQAQMTRLRGEEMSREAEKEKVEGLMGIAAGQLSAANTAVDAAKQRTRAGFGQALGGVASGLSGGIGGKIMKGATGKLGQAFGQTKLGGALGKLAAAGGGKVGEGLGFMSGAYKGLADRMNDDPSATYDQFKNLGNLFGLKNN